MARATVKKIVVGFCVKREYFTQDETNPEVRHKHRVQLGRVYHSKDAAQTLMGLFKKENPEWTLYVHEKTKREAELA